MPDLQPAVVSFTYEDGERLGCIDCTAGEPHVCPIRYADAMPEPRRSAIIAHVLEETG
jgi:hypothetical protein